MGRYISWGKDKIETLNTNRDGTGTVVLLHEAKERCWLDRVQLISAGTNVVAVARVFINNGQSSGTAANNILIAEITLPAATTSEDAAQAVQEASIGGYLNPGERVYVAVSKDLTSSAGYYGAAILGDHRSDFEAA